jgi:hypothetical protein
MGFSHERRQAAITILRTRRIARLTGDASIADDAEDAVSGFLDDEDLPEYLIDLYPGGLPADDPVRDLVPAGPAPLDSSGTPLAAGQTLAVDNRACPVKGRIVYLDDLYATVLITNEYGRPEYVPVELTEVARHGTVQSEI